MKPSVLLTNGQLRKTLASVRSLGSRKVRSLVADTTVFTPAGFSRYCSKALTYPSPVEKPEQFIAWVMKVLERERIDILYPMDDDTMTAVMNHREELERLVKLPIPPVTSYRIAADKASATKWAMAAGAPCPYTLEPNGPEEVNKMAGILAYPMVIKPRLSSGSRGIRIVYSPQELISQYEEIHKQFPLPMLQEYIEPGERFDVCMIYDREGKCLASFVQKELRHFPIERGPSTIQESVWYPELVELSELIMEGLPWQGIVELEFMVDSRDGLPKFMEINPRFWNSVQTSISSGVDFPWMLYQLATGGVVEEMKEYKVGTKCRWSMPGDILHFMTNPQRFAMDPPLWAGRRAGIEDDIWSIKDPMPTVGFGLACLRYAADPEAWKLVFRR
jgi:predicted ATP-grasp superfamily ATP-dependent carboligase